MTEQRLHISLNYVHLNIFVCNTVGSLVMPAAGLVAKCEIYQMPRRALGVR